VPPANTGPWHLSAASCQHRLASMEVPHIRVQCARVVTARTRRVVPICVPLLRIRLLVQLRQAAHGATPVRMQLIATRSTPMRTLAMPTATSVLGARTDADSFIRPLFAHWRHSVGTGFDGHRCVVRGELQWNVRREVDGIGVHRTTCRDLSRWRHLIFLCGAHRLFLCKYADYTKLCLHVFTCHRPGSLFGQDRLPMGRRLSGCN